MTIDPKPESQAGQIARARATIVPSEERLSLMDVWRVLMKRSFVILTVTVLSLAAAAIYSFRTRPVYESVSRIEIKPNATPNVGLQGLIEEGRSEESGSALQTEILVLQSNSVMLQTAESLNLLDRLRAANLQKGNAGAAPPTGEMTSGERVALIGLIKSGLHVQIVSGTQMVDIRYRSNDPKLAPEVVNKLVDTYIDEDLRSKFDRTMHVSVWLQKQLEDLKQAAGDAQRQLADYQKQHNIVGTDETSNLTMQNLAQTSSDLESAEADRIMKEARMRDFQSQDPDMVALMGDDPQLGALRNQLASLQTERAQLASKFGEHHPRMQELNAQIDKVQASIKREVALARRQVRDEYIGSHRLETVLQKRLEAQKEEAYRLNEDEAQYAILRHEAELNRDLYDALQMRLKEASVTAGLSATNITVVDRASVPMVPIAPKKTLSLILGLLGGLLCGVVLAFTIESIDDTLQTSEEVENVSMLASLATVPHISAEGGKRRRRGSAEPEPGVSRMQQLIALDNPKSHAAEAYRGLRSSLLLSSIDIPPRVIVITSAFPGEGKTTTAVNTAIAFAQRGERVLLVDADLRRGSLDRVFNLDDRSSGLSTVLTQPAGHRSAANPLPELPTLSVLATGPRPPNPAEMLSSNRMEEQLRQWALEFDRVIVDTAPVLAVSDTQALAALADTVILVARAGMTRKRALVRARDLLWRINAPIAGVVVNDVDMRLENFYTYRYGMYGYNYGQGYRNPRSGSDIAYGHEDEEKGE
ncbi:MAG: polysaccharide biosynthesis tyrosine autokinase [Terracidiphilus sp.]|jgi:capsular exopolysaccharide synthesis family protein